MLVPYPDSADNPNLAEMRAAAHTLEKLLTLLSIEAADFDLLTWQTINERYQHSGLGELALSHIEQQKQVVHASRQYAQIGLWEFHIGLIFLHWGKPQQALAYFATAQRYWTLANNTAAAYLALFAQGYIQRFNRLYAAAMASFLRTQHNLDRLQRPIYSTVNKAFITEMNTAVVQAITDLRRLSSQISHIRPSSSEELFTPSVQPPQQPTIIGRVDGPIPGHLIMDEQLIWYQIHRSHADDFLPEIEPDDWVLVRKSATNDHITPNDLVVVDDKTMNSSIWLTNTQAREPNAKFRIFLGRMIETPKSFTRDASGKIEFTHVQISEEQRATVDFEKIVGVVLGFWTSNVKS